MDYESDRSPEILRHYGEAMGGPGERSFRKAPGKEQREYHCVPACVAQGGLMWGYLISLIGE